MALMRMILEMKTGEQILELDQKESFIADLTNGFASEDNRQANSRLYVSSSGFCERKAALDATMPDRYGFSGVSNAYMRLGKAMETILLEGAYNSGRLLFADYSLPPIGLNVGGKVDGIMEYRGKAYVVEIKSIAYLPKEDEKTILLNPRYGQNVAQTSLYSAITGLPAMILFFSRFVKASGKSTNLAIKPIDLEFNIDRLKPYVESLALSSFAISENVLPDIPDDFDMLTHCGFCSFKQNCWDSGYFVLDENDEKLEQLQLKAKKFADHFMSQEEIEKRRHGVLKQISTNGTIHAEKLLHKKDWKNVT